MPITFMAQPDSVRNTIFVYAFGDKNNTSCFMDISKNTHRKEQNLFFFVKVFNNTVWLNGKQTGRSPRLF